MMFSQRCDVISDTSIKCIKVQNSVYQSVSGVFCCSNIAGETLCGLPHFIKINLIVILSVSEESYSILSILLRCLPPSNSPLSHASTIIIARSRPTTLAPNASIFVSLC